MKSACAVFFASGLFMISAGCGNEVSCALRGDNVRGHVVFDSSVAPATKNIVIQYSEDGFSTVKGSVASANMQGLISVPFTYCAKNDVNFSVRAFQDDNGNGAWDSGEGAGRDDDTTSGNGTYHTRNLVSSKTDWKVDRDVNISIDSTTSQ